MAKYSVGGTEVVRDGADIDWARIKNAPTVLSGAAATTFFLGAGPLGQDRVFLEVAGGTSVRVHWRVRDGNCNCG